MKKLSFAILILMLAIGIFAPSDLAANNEIRVTINGRAVNFPNQQPTIIDGRTLIPVRGVFEHLGFIVYWDQPTLTATLIGPRLNVINITAGAHTFVIDGREIPLDVPAQIIHGSTMLPMRAVLESVGYDVGWDGATSTVVITGSDAELNHAATQNPIAANHDDYLIFGIPEWQLPLIFNPVMSASHSDGMLHTLIFEGLISNNKLGEPIPLLATHWDISNNGRTITFHIDPRATFSDGGPLTAHDVAFTYHKIARAVFASPRFNNVQDLVGVHEFFMGTAENISGIRVIDDHTIEFTHIIASPLHVWNYNIGILCARHYAWEAGDSIVDFGTRPPLGSGQFTFVDYDFGQWIELQRNDNYWNTDFDINLYGIIFRNVPSQDIVAATINGTIHLGQANGFADELDLLQAAPGIEADIVPNNIIRHVTFNTTSPQLADHRVRQALAYAFDTQAYIITDTGNPRLRTVGNSPFSVASWANPAAGVLNNYEFNMARAARLMEEAGWTMGADGVRVNADGLRMSLLWLIYHEAAWPGIITGMAYHTWGELGIELDIQMMDFVTVNVLTTDMPPGEKQFDIFQMGWALALDPDLRGGLWDGSDAQNVTGTFFNSGFRHDRLIELIELGATTMDQAERAAIYHEIAKLTNYYLPVWVLSNGTQLWARDARVQNLEISPFIGPMLAVVQQGTWLD